MLLIINNIFAVSDRPENLAIECGDVERSLNIEIPVLNILRNGVKVKDHLRDLP
jgi:hypothetical protein